VADDEVVDVADDEAVGDAVVVAGGGAGEWDAAQLIEYSTVDTEDGPVTFRGGYILPLTYRG
jgi:hypothetical protein